MNGEELDALCQEVVNNCANETQKYKSTSASQPHGGAVPGHEEHEKEAKENAMDTLYQELCNLIQQGQLHGVV